MLKTLMRAFGLFLLVSQLAISSVALGADKFNIGGWIESTVSVRSFDSYASFFDDVAQWQLIDHGEVKREQLDAWNIAENGSAEFRLYANKGAKAGYVRLLKFEGVPQRYMRQDQQSWDTGGLFDLNMRAKNLTTKAEQVRNLGWVARAPVTRFQFGPYDVYEWIVASPDGFTLALVDRVSPKLEGWPNYKAVSRAINATQIVADFDRSYEFFTNVLGFEVKVFEPNYLSKESGPNSLGFPYNLQTVNPRKIALFNAPMHVDDGNVEIVTIIGLEGADHSHHANLPNFGLASLRFPATNLAALQTHFEQHKVDWVHKLKSINGENKLTIRAPEGGWLEFYEVESIAK